MICLGFPTICLPAGAMRMSDKMNESIKLLAGNGKTVLNYEITMIGQDYLILLAGGDAHIGCTAIGDNGKLYVYTPKSHRDDALAIPLAKKVSATFHCVCTVVAGFHLDEITWDEIETVMDNAEKGMIEVLETIEEKMNQKA